VKNKTVTCDRCGHTGPDRWNSSEFTYMFLQRYKGGITVAPPNEWAYDLCSKCHDSLSDWLKGVK
jgi:hypothetical protein